MTAVATAQHAQSVPTTAHVTFVGLVRSEWIKLFAVRSTPWILSVTILVMVGMSLAGAAGTAFTANNPEMTGGQDFVLDPSVGVSLVTTGYFFGQFVLAVLGVMVVTGEYGTGQIRATLAAAPTRLPVLGAKAVVVAVTAFVVGLLAVAISHLVTMPILAPFEAVADLGDSATRLSYLGVPLYLTVVALLALAVGFMLRHTAGAIFTIVGLFLVLPIVFSMVPLDILQDIAPYLPSESGGRLISGDFPDADLSPWQGFGVMVAWLVASVAGAAALLRRRDA